MDWITGISKAIDYIEEHITEPTDYARAAKEACSSPFNFQLTCRTLTIPARYGSQSNRKSKYFLAGARLGSGSFYLEERRKECYTY